MVMVSWDMTLYFDSNVATKRWYLHGVMSQKIMIHDKIRPLQILRSDDVSEKIAIAVICTCHDGLKSRQTACV